MQKDGCSCSSESATSSLNFRSESPRQIPQRRKSSEPSGQSCVANLSACCGAMKAPARLWQANFWIIGSAMAQMKRKEKKPQSSELAGGAGFTFEDAVGAFYL